MKRILALLCLCAFVAGVTAPVEIGRVNIGNGRDTIGAQRLGLKINAAETLLNGMTFINDLASPTFTRNLVAYNVKSMAQVAANVARTYPYPLGRFLTKNAVQIEGARTTLNKNVECVIATYQTRAGTITNTTLTGAYFTSATAIHFPQSSEECYAYRPGDCDALTVGLTYSLTAFIQMDDGSPPRIGSGAGYDFSLVINSSVSETSIEIIPFGGIYLVSAKRTAATTNQNNGIYRTAVHSGKGFIVTGMQLEVVGATSTGLQSSYIKSTIGALTRPADIYTADLSTLAGGGLSQTAGTIHLLVEPSTIDQDGATNYVLCGDSAGNFLIKRTAAGVLTVVKKDGAGTRTIADAACVFAANTKKLITVTWDATSLRCYVNGTATGTPVTGLAGAWSSVTNLVMGSNPNGDGTLASFSWELPVYDASAESAATVANVATTLGL